MKLVVQAENLAQDQLEHLGNLAQASKITRIADNAYRLESASNHPEIEPYCLSAKIDYGFVADSTRLSDFGLVVMDMDSTLINIECIDEIADMQGIKPLVAAITESAMRGEIDFAESLKRRVALLAGLEQDALGRVYAERLRPNPGATQLLAALKQHNIKTLLVSGGFTFFTDRLQSALGLDYTASNTLEINDGKLTGQVIGSIVDAQGKADWLNKIRTRLKLSTEQVIAIGDGANDLKMLAAAGTSIAYHAKPVVRSQADYALNFVGLDGVINLFGV